MAQVIDPMCGMPLDSATAAFQSTFDGRTYYFCSIGCQTVFDTNPAENAQRPPPATTLTRDPVCGMMVEPELALHRLEYGGRMYYFCSTGCRNVFAANPREYVGAPQPTFDLARVADGSTEIVTWRKGGDQHG